MIARLRRLVPSGDAGGNALSSHPGLRALAAALLVLVALLCAWWGATRWYRDRLLADRRDQEAVSVSLYCNALSLAIQQQASRFQELHAFVQANPTDPQFDLHFRTYASALYAGSKGIRSLLVAPGDTVAYVYPLAGNQSIIGYRPSDDPRDSVRADARQAIETGHAVLSDPLALPRGSVGITLYQAVNGDMGHWGLIGMLLDVSTLMDDTGLSAQTGSFALRDSGGHIFYGPPEVFARNPIIGTVELPEGAWQLGYVPRDGWQVPAAEYLAFDLAGLAIVLLLPGLTYLIINRQQQLALAVERRTAEIAHVSAQLQESHLLNEQTKRVAALEERQRLARDLHDSVSQALYGIGLGAQTARRLLDRDPSRAAEPMDYCIALTKAAIAEMRALIFELRPDSLEREGLAAALAKQTEALQLRSGLQLQSALCAEPALPLEVKEALYRIAQEALNNIAKHAQATHVEVEMSEQGGAVRLRISDDGVGFDPQGEYPGHLGLRSMAERARNIGAHLEIESSPGQGVCLQVRVPLAEGKG